MHVQSVRSLPAQIAVAFAPESQFTSSESGFPDITVEARRRRQDALKQLRRERPDLAKAAEQRRFRAGQKGSTFPWANTATALFEAVGPCWLASQIALLGASSPMRLGLKRQPEKSAFGSDCHPAALLDQVRANAASAEWWRSQLAALTATVSEATRERALAEWSMALWCAAEPKVVVELFDDWHRVMLDLPDPRRRPVVDAALRCSAHGWVPKLPSHLASEDPAIAVLLDFRNQPVKEAAMTSTAARAPRLKYKPLIEVARERRWFKVDDAGAYR